MKKHSFFLILLISWLTSLSGCAVVGGIFEAGMGVGIFLVVFVIAVIIFFVSRMGKNK